MRELMNIEEPLIRLANDAILFLSVKSYWVRCLRANKFCPSKLKITRWILKGVSNMR